MPPSDSKGAPQAKWGARKIIEVSIRDGVGGGGGGGSSSGGVDGRGGDVLGGGGADPPRSSGIITEPLVTTPRPLGIIAELLLVKPDRRFLMPEGSPPSFGESVLACLHCMLWLILLLLLCAELSEVRLRGPRLRHLCRPGALSARAHALADSLQYDRFEGIAKI